MTTNSDEAARKYRHALRDLTFNSKPIINNLTMLAHENIAHAPLIVKSLTSHLITVPSFN
jgi:pre-mRNA cleavage complex 2 protein Pcf11